MSQCHIYQLPAEAGYAFRGWNEAKDRFSIKDYLLCTTGFPHPTIPDVLCLSVM